MKTKKILVIASIVIGVLLLIIIILPFIFKDKIIATVKQEINNTLNAKVDWESVSFTLFKSFPDFKLELKSLYVKGINEFDKDTLAKMDNFALTINLFSVIKGDNYEIKSIEMNKPRVNAIVLKDGKANWDITKPSTDTTTTTAEEPSSFSLALNKVKIKDGYIKYRDDEMNFIMEISGLNHTLKGNLSESVTKIRTKTTAEEVTMVYEGVSYLSKNKLDSKFDMDANLDTWRFDFLENNIKLNDLTMNFEGFFQMNDTNYDMDLKFSTPSTEFKSLLSLIPAIFAKDFDKIETSGKFEFSGFAKGKYDSLNLPAFGLNLKVQNAMFKYPDLPKSVNNINIAAAISNKGGSANNTVINVNPFSFTMAGNPFQIKLLVSTPISDPNIDFSAKGVMDLNTVTEFYPLEKDQKLKGKLTADMIFKGLYSMIEKEQYDKFEAKGSLGISDFYYSDKDLPKGISISKGQLNFSPKYAELTQLDIKHEGSDISVKGKVDNILAYVFSKGVLKAQFTTSSTYFNTNPFLATDDAPATPSSNTESTPMEAFEIPDNIDFTLNSTFSKLIYDDLELQNINGTILVKDQKAELKNLKFNILDGDMTLNGFYSSKNVLPNIALGVKINQMDVQKTWKSFEIVKKFAPIAENAKGKFSAGFDLSSDINKDLTPKLETVNSSGSISTKSISIVGSQAMAKIATETKLAAFKQLNLNNISLKFSIVDGKLSTDPFTIAFNDVKTNVSGFSKLDQTLNYLLKVEVPRKAFGNVANDFVNNLTGKVNEKGANINLSEIIKFDVTVTGTFTNPIIKTGLKDKAKNVVEDVKETVKEEINKKKEEVITTVKEEASKAIAEAKKRADAIMAEAKAKADAVRTEAKKAGDKLIQEADAQGKKLIAEAKNPVAKLAAEKSAQKLNDEAKAKANKLNQEADQKANKIIKEAQTEADRIVKEAESKTK